MTHIKMENKFNLKVDGTQLRFIRAALRLLEDDLYENPNKYPHLLGPIKNHVNLFNITGKIVEDNIEDVINQINKKIH